MSRRWAREKAIQFLYQVDVRGEDRLSADRLLAEYLEYIKTGKQFTSVSSEENAEDEGTGIKNEEPDEDDRAFFGKSYGSEMDAKYVEFLVKGVLDTVPQLDTKISPLLKSWKIERIPAVDRALLRLGVFEITAEENMPKSVAINEIVILTKRFSSDRSRSYINGVLRNIDGDESLRTSENDGNEAELKPSDGDFSNGKL